jgi:uncharacterized pyridoxamine 5'-phosphate oxidase family protein
MLLSAPEQALQIANSNLLSFLTINVISLLIEIYRRLNAHFTPFYTQNVEHTALCIGTSPAARKSQSFVDFDEKCYFLTDCDISTFKRSFYSNFADRTYCTTRYASAQGLRLANRNPLSFLTKNVISLLIQIFRRLNVHFIPFYTQNVVHNALCVGTSSAARKLQSFVVFDEKCYFVTDCDISTFKRSFYSILYAERRALRFMYRNKPCSSQIAIFCRF